MMQYGLADAEAPYEDAIGIVIPKDLCDALFPHIQWALHDSNNIQRMSVEIAVEGLANVIGIVDQEGIIDLLKVVSGKDDEDNAKQLLIPSDNIHCSLTAWSGLRIWRLPQVKKCCSFRVGGYCQDEEIHRCPK